MIVNAYNISTHAEAVQPQVQGNLGRHSKDQSVKNTNTPKVGHMAEWESAFLACIRPWAQSLPLISK